MRGKGVKSVRGGAQGDLLCRVVVETPVGLNEKQKQLLKSCRRASAVRPGKQQPAFEKLL